MLLYIRKVVFLSSGQFLLKFEHSLHRPISIEAFCGDIWPEVDMSAMSNVGFDAVGR